MKQRFLIPILLLAASAVAQTSEPLKLSDAVALALRKNPELRMAAADQSAAGANVEMARSAFLPRVDFSESLARGNDPVYAFGTRLRQGRFTQDNFAIPSLNYPAPITDFTARVGGQWTVFNSFQDRFRLRAARSLQTASQRQLTRSEQATVYRVVESYYALQLAERQQDLAEQTLTTALKIQESANARVQAGTAVEADALSSQVLVASRQQELIRARGEVTIAAAQLETSLGARLSPGQQPANALHEQSFEVAELEQAEARALKQRPDLEAVAAQLAAQHDAVRAARSAYGPRLDVFGSWQSDTQALATGGNTNWMTGASLRIDLFAHDKSATLGREKAMLSRAEAAQQAAGDAVRMEVRRAWVEYDSARQMLAVARAATAQAEESLRIVRDRYESGLTPVTELLRAEDAARTTKNNYWQAVSRQAVCYAALQLATGELNEHSVVVTQ